MNRRTIRLAAAGSAVAVTMLAGGTAFAADYPNVPGGGGGSTPGGTGGNGGNGGLGNNGGTGGNGATFTSNGGALTSGGGASTTGTGTGTGTGNNLPFTGFELATALTLGVGAIGAGSVVVVASRRKRGSSAIA